MQTAEHMLTVIEPTDTGDPSIDITRDFVAKGGTALVILMITNEVRNHIREFAKSEGLDVSHAEAIAIDRLSETYASRTGGANTETIVVHSTADAHDILAHSARVNATSIVVSPNVLGPRGLQQITANANVPVVVLPARAA
jgi:hypothetical protein